MRFLALLYFTLTSLAQAGQTAGYYQTHGHVEFAPKSVQHCGQRCYYNQALVALLQARQYQSGIVEVVAEKYKEALVDSEVRGEFIQSVNSNVGEFCAAIQKHIPRPQGWNPRSGSSSEDDVDFLDSAYCFESFVTYHEAYLHQVKKGMNVSMKMRGELASHSQTANAVSDPSYVQRDRDSLMIVQNGMYSADKKPQNVVIQTVKNIKKQIKDSSQEMGPQNLEVFATEQFAQLNPPAEPVEEDFILFEKDTNDPTGQTQRVKINCSNVAPEIECRCKESFCYDAKGMLTATQRYRLKIQTWREQVTAIKEYGKSKGSAQRKAISEGNDAVQEFDQSTQYIVLKVNAQLQNYRLQEFPGNSKKPDTKKPQTAAARAVDTEVNLSRSEKMKREIAQHGSRVCPKGICDRIQDTQPGDAEISVYTHPEDVQDEIRQIQQTF